MCMSNPSEVLEDPAHRHDVSLYFSYLITNDFFILIC